MDTHGGHSHTTPTGILTEPRWRGLWGVYMWRGGGDGHTTHTQGLTQEWPAWPPIPPPVCTQTLRWPQYQTEGHSHTHPDQNLDIHTGLHKGHTHSAG